MYRMNNSDLSELTDWRREMHRWPELSGEEEQTARRVVEALAPLVPDLIETGVGGHGVLALFGSQHASRQRVLLRCELDALPIEDLSRVSHHSQTPGKGHLCGHDGHMAILMGIARNLSRQRLEWLDVILLFQPAEETGAGAQAVLEDGRLRAMEPDIALSLHNVPGQPLGEIGLASGPVNCASRGMKVTFTGRTAHASQPETGYSPGLALSEVIARLASMTRGAPDAPDFGMATVTHVDLGEKTFGIAPGSGEVWVTLRSLTDEGMEGLAAEAEALMTDRAAAHHLTVDWSYHDVFAGCVNHPDLTAQADTALRDAGFTVTKGILPMRWSEDFGRYGEIAQSVMLFPGSGVETPALHNPDYDFPDDLIRIGAKAFMAILNRLNEGEG
ncbi:amidohydrolase [Aliiroseovarius sp. KMU-50]|uniref:Amidohydrolase n=1 Tax=Aliiroseovarius salicola TaxID=3009082 RepID=A0ABT4W1P0_9RHOB|nr:amidohydrolase [Aliiroseovarius sp. KMU-50]MDA5094433.1 amidohydrolase [Aliiroseovarius sp. KMU-50]